MMCKDQLPEDGQFIVATNSVGGCWVEEYDSGEPIGDMKAWFIISGPEFDRANSPITMAHLFIKKYLESENGR